MAKEGEGGSCTEQQLRQIFVHLHGKFKILKLFWFLVFPCLFFFFLNQLKMVNNNEMHQFPITLMCWVFCFS